jgi:hypothetical protein
MRQKFGMQDDNMSLSLFSEVIFRTSLVNTAVNTISLPARYFVFFYFKMTNRLHNEEWFIVFLGIIERQAPTGSLELSPSLEVEEPLKSSRNSLPFFLIVSSLTSVGLILAHLDSIKNYLTFLFYIHFNFK